MERSTLLRDDLLYLLAEISDIDVLRRSVLQCLLEMAGIAVLIAGNLLHPCHQMLAGKVGINQFHLKQSSQELCGSCSVEFALTR